MRLLRGAAATAALATFILTACGGSSSATSTPQPPPTVVPTQAAAAASGSSTAGTAAVCPTGVPGNGPVAGTAARATGAIATINGTSFTVTQRDSSTVTVMTDTNTRYDLLTTANVGAIAVGDFITAQGTTSGNSVTATTITDAGAQQQQQQGAGGGNGQRPGLLGGYPPPGGAGQQAANGGGNGTGQGAGRGFTAGTVQQVNGATITVTTMLGTTTLTTDANTKVMRRQQGQFTDLKVGDQVTATAGRAANRGTVSAGSAIASSSFTAALVTDQTAH